MTKKYTLEDIEILKGFDTIKKRPLMYLHPNTAPLDSILKSLVTNLLCYDIKSFSVTKSDGMVLLVTEPDWLGFCENSVEDIFFNIHTHPDFPPNSMRAEVLLEAFEIPYYSSGAKGEIGDKRLLTLARDKFPKAAIERLGRILIMCPPKDNEKNFDK